MNNKEQQATSNNMPTRSDLLILYMNGKISGAEFEEHAPPMEEEGVLAAQTKVEQEQDHEQEQDDEQEQDSEQEEDVEQEDEHGSQADTISETSTNTPTRVKKNTDMRPCMRDGQNIRVITGRGKYTNYGNYRSDNNTLQDIETGIHYSSPTAFVKAQYLKIGKDVSVNGWDKIQCFTDDGWVVMDTLRT